MIKRQRRANGRDGAAAEAADLDEPTMVDDASAGGPLQQEMRAEMASLFAVLRPLFDQQKSMVLHFLSSSPGEGVTTVVRELAAVASSQDWCRVLVVDAGGGVFQAVAPSKDVVATRTESFGRFEVRLVRVANGLGVYDVAELSGDAGVLGGPTMIKGFYEAARERYALTLVDLPALSVWRDAAAISLFADGVLHVIESGKVRIPVIQRDKATIEAAGGHLLGVVFNKRRQHIPDFLYKFL